MPSNISKPWKSFAAALDDQAFLAKPLGSDEFYNLEPCPRALGALGLLEVCRQQSSTLIEKGHLKTRKTFDGVLEEMEFAFSILANSGGLTIQQVLARILREVVIAAHLQTTLRKMGQGQKCSLRFFPDGEILRPTGQTVGPGYSGSRLDNVIGMLIDIGVCNKSGKNYALTNRGTSVLASLEDEI